MVDAKLVVVGGATENDEIQLELPATLGRARESSIPLPHPLVSRQHCEIFERDGRLVVRDLDSTNGTFVGSERISESVLGHGQLLTIGTVTFRAFLGGESGSGSVVVKTFEEPDSSGDTTTLAKNDTGKIAASHHTVRDRINVRSS